MSRKNSLVAAISTLALLSACSSGQSTSGETAAGTSEAEPQITKPAETAPNESQAASVATGPSEAASAKAAPVPPAEIEGITNKRLSFAPGTSSATVNGSITGYETIDYLLNVRSGQPMNVSLATRHGATYFNLLEPDESDVAIHVGSTSGNQYEGVAKKSGDYRIRVYMMRSAARRNEKADYRLEAVVSP